MLPRIYTRRVRHKLARFPTVALLGPRRCGKTTLASQLGGAYFDMESRGDGVIERARRRAGRCQRAGAQRAGAQRAGAQRAGARVFGAEALLAALASSGVEVIVVGGAAAVLHAAEITRRSRAAAG